MKSKRASTKALLALIVTLILAVSFSVNAFAAERFESCGNRYGRIIPTDEKLDAQVFDYYFKGDSAPIHFMRMSTGTPGACYAVEIYADAERTTLIKYLSREYDATAGHSPVAITLSFDGLRSGTYYGRCYTYVTRSDGTIYDTDSIQNFNIHIDRLSNKTVVLSNAYNTDAGISVNWTPNATATQYHVYRKVNGAPAEWEYVVGLGEGANNYVDTNVVNGYTYTYTVRCSDGGYSSRFDATGVSVIRLSTPQLVGMETFGSNCDAKINWSPVEGADGYYVYRKGGSLSNYDWKLLANVQGGYSSYYIDTTAKSVSWCYEYTVVAYKGASVSSYNPVGLEFNYMTAPVLTKVMTVQDGVYLEWYTNNRNSQGFAIYRKAWDNAWEFIGATQNTWYADVTAASGVDYAYTIVDICATNESAFYPDGIKIKYLSAPQINDITFDAYNNAVISWGYVNGAEKYQVYRKLSYETDWVLIGETYDLYYYDSIEKYSGELYTYTVVACSGAYRGSYDLAGKSSYFLSAPEVRSYNVYFYGADGIEIDWTYVNGATSYDVYRCDYGSGNWVCIASGLTSNWYVDFTASDYYGYNYTVVATNGVSYSRFNESTALAVPSPKLEYAVVGNEGGVHLGWSAINDGAVYHVYRKAVDGAWVEIGTTTTNSFVDWSEEAVNQFCVYTVVAEIYNYLSGFDTEGIANFTEVKSLSGALVDGETPYIELKWELDGVAQWYELIKTVNGQSTSLGVFAGDSGVVNYVDTDIEIGNVYTYSITAGCEGRFSKTNSVDVKHPLPPVPAAQIGGANAYVSNGKACVDIVWGYVDFAESYTVYRRTDGADWVALATISVADLVNGPVFTDTTAEFDVLYYYTVVGNASNRDSLYDNVGVSAIALKPVSHPYGVTVREDIINTQTVAVIGWDAVDKAEFYSVFRKEAGSDWVCLGTNWDGSCSFIDNTIVQGVKYTYTVSAGANGRGEALNPVGATYRWNINDAGLVPADYTGLFEYNGTWYYFENGRINWGYNSLVNFNNTWYYVSYGEVAWDYSGLVSYYDDWYYVENGILKFNTTSLVEYNGGWYYVVNSYLDRNVTTLVYYNGVWFYVENGAINWNCNTLVNYNDAWFYVYNGQIAWDYTGLVSYYNDWYYVENGVLNFDTTTLVEYNGGWYYVVNSYLDRNVTTLVLYNDVWFYVENGAINWDYNSLVNYDGAWFYVCNGQIAWDYTGLVSYYNDWYYVENGVLNFDATTLVEYDGGWYYVVNSYLDRNVTTLVLYNDVWYYVENGAVNWQCDTLIKYNDVWFYVYGGKLAADYTGLVSYNGELYYVENGRHNTSCEAIASYEGVKYYVVDGMVAWNYSGDVVVNNIMYRVQNGIATDVAFDLNPVY